MAYNNLLPIGATSPPSQEFCPHLNVSYCPSSENQNAVRTLLIPWCQRYYLILSTVMKTVFSLLLRHTMLWAVLSTLYYGFQWLPPLTLWKTLMAYWLTVRYYNFVSITQNEWYFSWICNIRMKTLAVGDHPWTSTSESWKTRNSSEWPRFLGWLTSTWFQLLLCGTFCE